MKIIKKGEFGYIKFQRTIEYLKTIFMLCLCIGMYYLGIYSTGSNKNLLTYVAILGCLPMAKFAVNAVLFTKAKGCSFELNNEIKSMGLSPLFYDLYFTSTKKNFQISVLDYKKKNLIMFSEDSSIDITEGEKHIQSILEKCGYENITVKIFDKKETFLKRLQELNDLNDDPSSIDFLKDNILSVSI